jgi:hypothetical protein
MNEWSVNLELDGQFTQDQAEDLIDRLGDRAAGAVSLSPTRLGIRFYVEADFAHTAIERATKEIQKLLGESAFTIAGAEAQTPEELDRVLERPTFPNLLGVTEVGRLLHVSRQRVDEIARTHENFPKPAVKLAAGPIWERAAIERFVEEWPRRAGRPPKADEQRLTAEIQAALLGAGEDWTEDQKATLKSILKKKLDALGASQKGDQRHRTADIPGTVQYHGQIVASPIHSFLHATKFMGALSQLPGIHSVKLRTYSGTKATIEVVTEGRPVGAIDYTRMDAFQIEMAESSEDQIILRVISGTGAPRTARR